MSEEKEYKRVSHSDKLEELRQLLLYADREELQRVRQILDSREQLASRVSPIFEARILEMKENFPREFGKLIDEEITRKLETSKEELLNIIYPLLGKMIKKYVSQQIQSIKDNIDEQMRNAVSSSYWKSRFKAMFLGVNNSDILLSNLQTSSVEEIYVIQRDSGLLIGSYSRNATLDQDMIAGMLTAIKSFVEDAFQHQSDELETIEYANYRILLQSFYSYYFAVVVNGSFSLKEKDKLSNEVATFASRELSRPITNINSELHSEISLKLKNYFNQLYDK